MSDTTMVLLTDDELAALDGKCRDEIQAKVTSAKERMAVADSLVGTDRPIALFIGALVQEARTHGRLVFQHTGVEHCPVCDRRAEHAKHKRGGRNHRKGDPDHRHLIPFGAYEFAHRFITIGRRLSLGCCDACWLKAKPLALTALADVQAVVPDIKDARGSGDVFLLGGKLTTAQVEVLMLEREVEESRREVDRVEARMRNAEERLRIEKLKTGIA